jgi:hypothetical protein
MMIFGEPHRKDIELPIARKHRIEGRQASQCFFHHLRPRIDECELHGHKKAKGKLALSLLIERTDHLAQVIDLGIGGVRCGRGLSHPAA